MNLDTLITDIKQCRVCAAELPCGPNPVLRVGRGSAQLLIIGQAPGTRVHATGIPWNDASGNRLRAWLGLTSEDFYNQENSAIMPMGFCYPGKGPSGDLPPRPECAPLWHDKVLRYLPHIKLTLLIGHYAQKYYLRDRCKKSLTETVRAWQEYIDDGYMPLVHPSPRNVGWLRKNDWFEKDIIPHLQEKIEKILKT